MSRRPRLIIGGTGSGVGKTSVSIALTAALARRGLAVQTFKAGPDFLDPAWLVLASSRPCYNLDGWMCGETYVRGLFARQSADCDLALIEGVMGLFDGASATSLEGSTAELARWLDAPVLLVANAHGSARSLAATVAGFAAFEPGVRVGGVLANHCGSDRHAASLDASLRAAHLPPQIGALPRGAFPSLPSRHLGLAAPPARAALEEFAVAAERHLDLNAIFALAHSAPPLLLPGPETTEHAQQQVRLGVAHDEAFNFYYPDNLAALESAGATLVRFSPIADRDLPGGLDGLYIGGGYPEVHAAVLSSNTTMLAAIRAFAGSGRPVYAECGGLMYLSQGIETTAGEAHPMASVLPARTRMLGSRKALGYVEATAPAGCLFAEPGTILRGHEFHYSELVDSGWPDWQPAWRILRRREGSLAAEGFQRGRTVASYIHLHFACHPGAAARFVDSCLEARQ